MDTGGTTEEEDEGDPDFPEQELSEWVKPTGDELEEAASMFRFANIRDAESDTESEGGGAHGDETDEEDGNYVMLPMTVNVMEDAEETIAGPSRILDLPKDGDDDDEFVDLEPQLDPSSGAMEYDNELLFKHLCFYLDSPPNAKANGMSVTISSSLESAIIKAFAQVEREIIENGGWVTSDLKEAKLTHIVLDKRDTKRRVELMRQTSKPKRRHLILSSFVSVCLEENSLLDEDGFVA